MNNSSLVLSTLLTFFLSCILAVGYSQRVTSFEKSLDIGLPSPELTTITYYDGKLYCHNQNSKIYSYDGYTIQRELEDVKITGYLRQIIKLEKGEFFFFSSGQSFYKTDDQVYAIEQQLDFHIILQNGIYIFPLDQGLFYFNEEMRKLESLESNDSIDIVNGLLAIKEYEQLGLFYIHKFEEKNKRYSYLICPNSKAEKSIDIEDFVGTNSAESAFLYLANDRLVQDDCKTKIFRTNPFGLAKDSKEKLNGSSKISTSILRSSLDINQKEILIMAGSENSTFYRIRNIDQIDYLGEMNVYAEFPKLISESNIWMSSHNGLFEINPAIQYFDTNDENMISAIHAVNEGANGEIYIGGYGTGITKYDGKKFESVTGLKTRPQNQIIPGSIRKRNGTVLMIGQGPAVINEIKDGHSEIKSFVVKGEKIRRPAFYIDTLRSGQLIFGLAKEGLGLVEKIDIKGYHIKLVNEDKGMHLVNVLTATEDLNNRIWMGRTSTGVSLYDPIIDSAYTFRHTADPKTFGAISSELDTTGNLWLGSDDGLFMLKNPELFEPEKHDFFDSVRKIILPDGFNKYVTILKQYRHYLIIGTNTSISFLDLHEFYKNNAPDSPKMYSLFYGQDIKGKGAEQNAILIDRNEDIWIGSQEGLSKINFDFLKFDTIPIRVKLISAKSGETNIAPINNTIEIPKDNRNLNIKFGPARNPSLKRNIFFEYLLTNEKGDTIVSQNYDQKCEFSIPYIPIGEYNLHIKARKNGLINDELELEINVPKSLTESVIFWVALSLVIFGSIGGMILLSSYNKRRLLEKDIQLKNLENEKDKLDIQTIISSFNPHFINNSLHWIQSRYRKDDSLVGLVANLSKNIQYIFENTRKGIPFHTISEEIELVKNYVAVQNVRFNNAITLNLPPERLINEIGNHKILLMQIQIHVENAIEHGIRNRKGSGTIKIDIKSTKENIIIVITDDGIGRVKAKAMGSGGTQQGTAMLKKLHEIYNVRNSNKITSNYHDSPFTDENGANYGTKLTIIIPKNYQYELQKTKYLRH